MMDRQLDLRLKEIRGRISQADPMLLQLLYFATHSPVSFQYGLVLILDGFSVRGIPAPSATTGEALDRQSIRFLRSMQAIAIASGGIGQEEWQGVTQWYKENPLFLSQAKADDEARVKVQEKIGDVGFKDIAELLDKPDDVADEAASAYLPMKAFTLTNAEIRSLGSSDWEAIPNMRVNTLAVRAWWTFDLGIPDEAREIFARLDSEE